MNGSYCKSYSSSNGQGTPRHNMGPTALFDKSFIQGLSLDESVWFDNFFIANVCPIFFAETLADLDKSTESRSPEDEVRIIADKFPERSGRPNAHHVHIGFAEASHIFSTTSFQSSHYESLLCLSEF